MAHPSQPKLHSMGPKMRQLASTALVALAFFLCSPTSHALPPVRVVDEATLRDLVGESSELSYMTDFVDHLRDCGITGEIVQLTTRPSGLPDVRGLHLLVREVRRSHKCWSGHWKMLDNPDARERLGGVLRAGRLLFIALQTFANYHSAVADPDVNGQTGRVRKMLAREGSASLLVFVGRNAVFEDEGGLVDDLLTLATLGDLPARPLMSTFELISSARRPKANVSTRIEMFKGAFDEIKLKRCTAIEIGRLLKRHVSVDIARDLITFLDSKCQRRLSAAGSVHH